MTIDKLRLYVHCLLEKNTYYEDAVDKDDFVDRHINEMTHVELVEALERAAEL